MTQHPTVSYTRYRKNNSMSTETFKTASNVWKCHLRYCNLCYHQYSNDVWIDIHFGTSSSFLQPHGWQTPRQNADGKCNANICSSTMILICLCNSWHCCSANILYCTCINGIHCLVRDDRVHCVHTNIDTIIFNVTIHLNSMNQQWW